MLAAATFRRAIWSRRAVPGLHASETTEGPLRHLYDVVGIEYGHKLTEQLLPLGTRIRIRLAVDAASPQELAESLRHALEAAGAAQLMTPALIEALATHAAGNRRVLMNLAAELLAAGVSRNLSQLDETLFFAVCGPPTHPARPQAKRR